jgi:Zn-dependent protease/predicted transcriptional regulator
MKWSWRLGRFAGIDVNVHATFLFLVAWIALAEYARERSAAAAVEAVAFILAVFATVVLHEYGHALTARRYGVRTRSITLLPIGGVASLERIPADPKQELAIAIAGPLVNVAIAAVLYAVLRLTGQPVWAPDLDAGGGPLLTRLLWVNVVLVLFNLIPAFPMDGGRVLRAALAMRLDYVRATSLAARVGQAFALAFGIAGFYGNPFLIFIAIFVWMGASGESTQVRLQAVLHGLPVDHIMIRDLRTLEPQEPLSRAVEHLLAGFQQDFPVLSGSRVVGVLTRTDLIRALTRDGPQAPVSSAMRTDFQVAQVGEPLEVAFTRLQGGCCQTMPVVSGERLAGVLTLENVGEYVAVSGARR